MRFLDKHSAREKQLRRLHREMGRLQDAQDDAPVVPLEHPFQRGWGKTYVLVDGIDRRLDANIFRTLLATVNCRVWARDRSFVHHRTREPIVLRPRVIPLHMWERLGWPASHRRLLELGTWRVAPGEVAGDDDGWHYAHNNTFILQGGKWTRWVHGYKLVHIWWLREDVQPHLITHQRIDLPEVKSRLAEIEAYMTRTRGWDQLGRLRGRSQRRWRNRIKVYAQERAALVEREQTLSPQET